jgi:hypothetical protein
MAPELKMLRCLLAGVITFFSVTSGLAQSTGAAGSAPNGESASASAAKNMQQVAPGDHWTFDVKDEISGTIRETRKVMVTDVSKDAVAVRIDFVKAGRTTDLIYDRSWNVTHNDTTGAKYSPNDGTGVKFPLTLNAQWKFSVDEINLNTGATWKHVGDSKVIGREIVTTKAGQFETFVIDTHFVSRNTKDPTRTLDASTRTWFDTDINHWVKRSTVTRREGHVFRNDTIELIDYGRKKQ